jgi:hypothetical protein
MPLPGPHQVKGGVHPDSVKPGAEVGAGFEPVQAPVGPQESLLHDLFGVLLVAGHPETQSEEAVAVTFYQHLESLLVSGAYLRHDGFIAPVHPNH